MPVGGLWGLFDFCKVKSLPVLFPLGLFIDHSMSLQRYHSCSHAQKRAKVQIHKQIKVYKKITKLWKWCFSFFFFFYFPHYENHSRPCAFNSTAFQDYTSTLGVPCGPSAVWLQGGVICALWLQPVSVCFGGGSSEHLFWICAAALPLHIINTAWCLPSSKFSPALTDCGGSDWKCSSGTYQANKIKR